MSEQVDADTLRPAGARRRSWTRSRRLWGLLGALCCLLAAADLALAGVKPLAPAPNQHLASIPDYVAGGDAPVLVCATQHYTPGAPGTSAWPGGTCSQNDAVLSMSDASHAWVTFHMNETYADEAPRPATVYLRQHDGHWRSFVTCNGGRDVCALPLPSIFQAVGLTFRAGTTYDVGAYVHADGTVCDPGCTPALAEPGLSRSFTITAKKCPYCVLVKVKSGHSIREKSAMLHRSWFDTHRILTALVVVLVFCLIAGAVVVQWKTTDVPTPTFALAIFALALASLAAVLIVPRAQAALAPALEAMRYRVAIGGAHVTLQTGPLVPPAPWPEARGSTTYMYDLTWRDQGASGFYAVSVRNPSTDDARIMATAYLSMTTDGSQTSYTGALWDVAGRCSALQCLKLSPDGTWGLWNVAGRCSYAAGGSRGRDAFIVSVSGSTCGTLKVRALAVEKAVLARL